VKREFADLPVAYPGSDRKAQTITDIHDDIHRRPFALGMPARQHPAS